MSMPFEAGSRLTAAALDELAVQVLQLATDTTTTSTTPTSLLTGNVDASTTYWVDGILECVIGGTSTPPKIGFYGTATESAMSIGYSMFEESTSGESIYGGRLTAMSSNSAQTATFANGSTVQVRFSGTVTFSGAGTFIIEAGDTTSGDHYTVKAGSGMILIQQT